MNDKRELVSVIIPTWKRKEMVVRCIDSVLKNTYRNLEVIVCEDPSDNCAEEAIRKRYSRLKNFTYMKNKTMGLVAATVNRMLRASKGKLIFLLNDDNVIDRRCIEELVSTMGKFPDVGIVGPLAFYYSKPNIIMHAGTIRSGFVRGYTSPFANKVWKNQLKEGDEVEDFGNAFMFRREAVYKAGMWDLLVPAQGEDGDFEARVRRAGYRVVINPKAKSYHDVPYVPAKNTMSLFFDRIDKVRIYHGMHSKILYEFRYEKPIQKITFLISFPLYFGYHTYAVIKARNRTFGERVYLFYRLLSGIVNGFKDALLNRSRIEYLKK
jgi:hypothetical protein